MKRTISRYSVETPPTKGVKKGVMQQQREIAVTLSPTRITSALLAAAVVMGIAATAVQWLARLTGNKPFFGLVRLLHLEEEANLPTAFSVLLLALASLLLAVISWNERRAANANATHWIVLTVGFCLMVLDEFAMLHEMMSGPGKRVLGNGTLGPLFFTWVLPAFFGLAAIAIYFVPFLRQLPRHVMYRFVSAGAVYVAGCVGLEMLGGMRFEQFGRDPLYLAFATFEELMEMTGVVLFIRALIHYLSETAPDLRLSFRFSST
ncbi:MAG: hypothetical protein JNL62_17205 [Bryobacterales bacterium]|nr:hypothetical protein [Bryobacterales bacterium]